MNGYDLRPLSAGEILDRTFSLYRRNFLLFVGISAVPSLLVLPLNMAQVVLDTGTSSAVSSASLARTIALLIVGVVAYLVAQGAATFAVSDVYLGRACSIGGSLKRVRGELGSLFGVITLNGLACGLAVLALVVPGIYVACRLLVWRGGALPAGLSWPRRTGSSRHACRG